MHPSGRTLRQNVHAAGEEAVTDPKPVTRTLLLEIRDPAAGVVEVFSPSDAEMAELGWTRVPAMSTTAGTIDEAFSRATEIPELVVPTNGHSEEKT